MFKYVYEALLPEILSIYLYLLYIHITYILFYSF